MPLDKGLIAHRRAIRRKKRQKSLQKDLEKRDLFVSLIVENNQKKTSLLHDISERIIANEKMFISNKMKESFRRIVKIFDKLDEHKAEEANLIIKVLKRVVEFNDFWIREPETSEFRSHNLIKQLNDFITHLFAKYKTPIFLYQAFYTNNADYEKFIFWFIDVANGRNIRNSVDLPMPLTKKIAYLYPLTPNHIDMSQGFRYSQVKAMGGSDYVAEEISKTFLGNEYRPQYQPFWESVIRFFIENPFLERKFYGPICDYLRNQKYVKSLVLRNGQMVEDIPQPNLSMHGRTADRLLQDVEKWHKELAVLKTSSRKEWPHHPKINDFEISFGEKETLRTYKIKQILNEKELQREGKTLHHCVYSYSSACVSGDSSIWSMSITDCVESEKKLITIEVNKYGRICQVRGSSNRNPNKGEQLIIGRWASQEGIGYTI